MLSREELQSHNHLDPVDFDMITKHMGDFNVNAAIDLFHIVLAFCFCLLTIFPFLNFLYTAGDNAN